jgi:glutamate N-acetyltransferase/amino-acid N-acetyltransferase
MKIHIPAGFLFAAASAGIKASGRPDLGYAEAPAGASAAALFTRNRLVAAPVELGRDHLRRTNGRVHSVLVNSGNANCANGKSGLRACRQVCKALAGLLEIRPESVFPSSTGVIGVPLPTEKLISALPQLLQGRRGDEDAVRQFSAAIMTTDTRPKIASVPVETRGGVASVLGIAKGAGMIAPNMATMLVYVFTDIQGAPRDLHNALHAACENSFNCISVDHDTSTNDTLLLLASGKSPVRLPAARAQFAEALTFVCRSLAEQVVSDGEGTQHVARLCIEGARHREEALTVAKTIASSILVKTALAGADPNWGRILAAIGRCPANVDPHRVNIYIGPQQVCRNGESHKFDETAAHRYLSQPSYEIRVQLGRGKAALEFLTTDLTAEYVRLNAEYST